MSSMFQMFRFMFYLRSCWEIQHAA